MKSALNQSKHLARLELHKISCNLVQLIVTAITHLYEKRWKCIAELTLGRQSESRMTFWWNGSWRTM